MGIIVITSYSIHYTKLYEVAAAGAFVVLLSGIRWRLVFGLGAILGAMAPVLWTFMYDYQRNRVLTFLDPERDPLGTGYHIRITSYNVCYTKLLRAPGVPAPRPGGEGAGSGQPLGRIATICPYPGRNAPSGAGAPACTSLPVSRNMSTVEPLAKNTVTNVQDYMGKLGRQARAASLV